MAILLVFISGITAIELQSAALQIEKRYPLGDLAVQLVNNKSDLVSGWSADQIKTLTGERLAAMSLAAFGKFNTAQIGALSAKQLEMLNLSQLTELLKIAPGAMHLIEARIALRQETAAKALLPALAPLVEGSDLKPEQVVALARLQEKAQSNVRALFAPKNLFSNAYTKAQTVVECALTKDTILAKKMAADCAWYDAVIASFMNMLLADAALAQYINDRSPVEAVSIAAYDPYLALSRCKCQ